MKEKVRKFFMDLRKSWKSIKFISRKNALKRTVVVLVTMLMLGLLIMVVDWLIGNGFKALSMLTLDMHVLKTVMTVIFSVAALIVIVLGTLIKSKTKSFTAPVNQDSYWEKHKSDPQYKMSKAILISSIICFISAVGAYIFQ